MSSKTYLHQRSDFNDLIQKVSDNLGIHPVLVEKDYYIMHCLYSLQKQGYVFELKGGTSLSKGYGLIQRFSEDIDICIYPQDKAIKYRKNHTKDAHNQSRKSFYDGLAEEINIDGIASVERDTAFDDIPKYRSAGIRLMYDSTLQNIPGVKDGILLELGFDQTTPSKPLDISSWVYEEAIKYVECKDNRAIAVSCYDTGYTLVEKLQAISTKYRKQQETSTFPTNFMRHYYDVYCLLGDQDVKEFIGTDEYITHKEKRFPQSDEKNISKNSAFLLESDDFDIYEKQFNIIAPLFYQAPPSFQDIMKRIWSFVDRL